MINTYISSSNIARIGWAHRVLYIEFNNGGVYAYKDADYSVYDKRAKAESAGQYFAKNIRYNFEYTKLDYDPFAPRVRAKVNTEFAYRRKLETKESLLARIFKEKMA